MIEPLTSTVNQVGESAPERRDPVRIREAAQQFEAMLIGQMMKSMCESQGGWLGSGDDQSSSCALEYAQEMFGQALAANGGLGLAKIVAEGFPDEAGSR
jgi:peptidoglycan hydrolase FlgJ